MKLAGFDFPADQIAAQFAWPIFRSRSHEDLTPGVMNTLEQRKKGAATALIQLAHHIVDEQKWRCAMGRSEIFSLGHFQGYGQRTLLTFTSELRRRTPA